MRLTESQNVQMDNETVSHICPKASHPCVVSIVTLWISSQRLRLISLMPDHCPGRCVTMSQ